MDLLACMAIVIMRMIALAVRKVLADEGGGGEYDDVELAEQQCGSDGG